MAKQCSNLEELYEWCLKQHYLNNDHHPQHFEHPYSDMCESAKMELTCDLLACVLGIYNKKGIPVSLSECRAVIENGKWPTWNFAVKEHLPIPSNINPPLVERWIHFGEEERQKLKELFEQYKNGKVIRDELEKLNCVQYYLDDLRHHKSSVYQIWEQIPEFKVPGMRSRIQHHDDDKYDTIMILGYTANWCFETVKK